KIRTDFPILKREINDQSLIYMDNAATTQKPRPVIDAICDFYENYNANVYRGVHTLSGEATTVYEKSRKKVADFIGAKEKEEDIFTKVKKNRLNYISHMISLEVKSDDEII